ncbi:ABC transporter substrate-binding protein [Nonomuraea sp. NPDC050310]|uniref:ABC transporter substrate-binding protein n=1 Tax=Nonomuraea sp. NPDC050310 TaxID=3154935 RepID=UPI0033BFD5EA
MTVNRRALAVLAAGALVLTGCAKGGAGGSAPGQASQSPSVAMPTQAGESKQAKVKAGTPQDSQGPAIEVPGSKKGGTVRVIASSDFSHLDPGQIYVSNNAQASELINRGLMGYKQLRNGDVLVVGDLSADTGTTTDGGKTWTFKLKDGVKWEDGEPVTSEDVKWSFERLYDPIINQGPTYVQQWLVDGDYRKTYPGAYSGKRLDTIETPDAKTVVFNLKSAHPDFNMALAMSGYGIVPKKHTMDKSKQKDYDKKPVASGPYRVVSHIGDKSMDLERNPHWDPATDPIRNAYPDKWRFEFGVTAQQSTDRLIADSGDDQTTISINGLGSERIPEVVADGELMKRSISGYTPFTDYWVINTSRVKNPKVREALIKAWPIEAIHKLSGGDAGWGHRASTMMSPTVPGFRKFDVWGQLDNPEGDIEAAKKLLAESGEPNPTIVYAYGSTPLPGKVALLVQEALTKAGFKYVGKKIDSGTWYDSVGQLDNGFDVFRSGWAADWADGSTVMAPLFDGRLIAEGSTNYSQFNDPAVNSAIDEANKLTDPEARGEAWSKIDEQVIKQAAVIPGFYLTYLDLRGSKVWAEMDNWWGSTNLKTAFVAE